MSPVETPRGIILFIHGFGSSHKTWTPLLNLLKEDRRVTSSYDLATWDYPTKWVELNVLGRIPRLSELGRSLGDAIDSPEYRTRPLTLVGHSTGGLVIQSFIASVLQAGQASKLQDIRQVILFATPSSGSTTAMSFRRLASKIFRNPQEIALRVLDPEVADIVAVIRDRVVSATRDTDIAWRIPIHAVSGIQDDVVPEASARGPFDNVKRVRGTHFSVITPENREDARYKTFVGILLDPGGHSHRFEIDRYETKLAVEPRPRQTIQTKTTVPRLVEFDNYATLKRTCRFTASNTDRNPFFIRYGTQANGYVVGRTSHVNEASSTEQGRIEDTGTYYRFDFTPRPATDFWLTVEVYGGYGLGHRDAHFHLGNDSYYRNMRYTLDLSAYVGAGYVIYERPKFYLHPDDPPHGELCSRRDEREILEPSSASPSGVYTWELSDIRKATVDIAWDVKSVEATLSPSIASANPTIV